MSQNMRYYLKVPANFITIQILPAKVGRPMLNFGRPIVKCTPKDSPDRIDSRWAGCCAHATGNEGRLARPPPAGAMPALGGCCDAPPGADSPPAFGGQQASTQPAAEHSAPAVPPGGVAAGMAAGAAGAGAAAGAAGDEYIAHITAAVKVALPRRIVELHRQV